MATAQFQKGNNKRSGENPNEPATELLLVVIGELDGLDDAICNMLVLVAEEKNTRIVLISYCIKEHFSKKNP